MLVAEFKEKIKAHIHTLLVEQGLGDFFETRIVKNFFTIRLKKEQINQLKLYNPQKEFHLDWGELTNINLSAVYDIKDLREFELVYDVDKYLTDYKNKVTDYFTKVILKKKKFITLKEILLQSPDNEGVSQQEELAAQTRLSLKSLKISNFQGVKSTQLTNVPPDTQWIFLTGENGFGKTSILQAIAFGLYGFESHTFELMRTPIKIELELYVDNQLQQIALNPNQPRRVKNLVAYGSSRLDMIAENNDNKETESPTVNLFKSRTFLKNIELQLSRWYFKRDDREFADKFANVIALFKKILPNIREISVDRRSDTIFYTEQDMDGNLYEAMPFYKLASGYKSLIAVLGDMILRLFKQQPHIHNPADLLGIVIIDELDLHFHPKIQRELPKILSNLFPKIQFIASTHSPIPILGAPSNSVFLKVTRSQNTGIILQNLDDIEVRNLTPDTILSSPIFDFDNLISEAHNHQERLRTEKNYQELKLNDEIKNELKKIAQQLQKNP
jgi:predicted ATP-binding protein involved in virulence